jgi:membrane associated rhomboid family serine protease
VLAHLLLLTVVLDAVTLVRGLRRGEILGRGYLMWVSLLLLVAVISIARNDAFVGVVAVGLSALSVVVPWGLELAARGAFGARRLALGVLLSRFRAMLMPGSALQRQLELMEGLAALERDGVDAALGHFRAMARETEDEGELLLIDEQIISTLFYGRRWTEGIAHYERRFQPGYAALRPGLALGLMRAYGEARRIGRAAALLRALEASPLVSSARGGELLGQARLTFLAYAGASGPLESLASEDRFSEFGLTRAAGTFFHGVALARSGEAARAETTLRRVESLAGPAEQPVVDATQSLLGDLADAALELEPELRSYAQGVAQRLAQFAGAAPALRSKRRLWVTYTVMIALATVYGMVVALEGGGATMLELGGLAPWMWRAGAYERAVTSIWLHGDVLGLLFDVYAVWLAGQLVERVHGPARMLALLTVPAAFGGAVGLMIDPQAVAVGSGALMSIAGIVGALWTLLPRATPALPRRGRRNLVITLSLLLVAIVLSNLPGGPAAAVSPGGFVATITLASLVSLIPRAAPGSGARMRRVIVLGLGSLHIAAFAAVLGGRVDGGEATRRCTRDGFALMLPERFAAPDLQLQGIGAEDATWGFPVLDAPIDRLELSARAQGGVVQVTVSRVDEPVDGQPGIFAEEVAWSRRFGVTRIADLPQPFAELGARGYVLRANGEPVAALVERDLTSAGGGSVVATLVASPPSALGHHEAGYARALGSADTTTERGDRWRCTLDER